MKRKIWKIFVVVVLIFAVTYTLAGCETSNPGSLKKKLTGKEFWSIPDLIGNEKTGYYAECISILFLDDETAVIYDFDTHRFGDNYSCRGLKLESYDEFEKHASPIWYENDNGIREWEIMRDGTLSLSGNSFIAGYYTWSENKTDDENAWCFKNGKLRIGDYEFTSKCPIKLKNNDHKYDVEKLLKEYRD